MLRRPPKGASRSAQVLEQHERLLLLVERLGVVAELQPKFLQNGYTRSLLEKDLREMHGELTEHFAFEEEGGYLAEALARRPTLTPKAQNLQSQHAEILKTVAGLLAGSRDLPLPAFKEKVLALLEHLRGHEAAETDLLQEAFSGEVGAGD